MAYNLGTALKSGINGAYGAGQFSNMLNMGNQFNQQQQQQQPQNNSLFGSSLNQQPNQQQQQFAPSWSQFQQTPTFGNMFPGMQQQGTQGNPYSAQNQANGLNGLGQSDSKPNSPSQQGAGGTPVWSDQSYNGFSQFFNGGNSPDQMFNLSPADSQIQKPEKDLDGWKWWAGKGLGALESIAPLAGGIAGFAAGGPAGAYGGQALGGALSGLANLGQQALRGK